MLSSPVIYNAPRTPLLPASVPSAREDEIDPSVLMPIEWPTVGVSPSHTPADNDTCQFQSQLTLADLDHQLDLITRSESPS